MAQYYVFQSTTEPSGEPVAVTPINAETEEQAQRQALMLYHQILASAYANPEVTAILCKIWNEVGAPYKDEYFGTPTPLEETPEES